MDIGLTQLVLLITAIGMATFSVAVYFLSKPIFLSSQAGYVDVVCRIRAELANEFLGNAETTLKQLSLRHNLTRAFVSQPSNRTYDQLAGLLDTMSSTHSTLGVRTYMANGTRTAEVKSHRFDTSVNYDNLFPLDQSENGVELVLSFLRENSEPWTSGPYQFKNSTDHTFYAFSLTMHASDRIQPHNSTLSNAKGNTGIITCIFLGDNLLQALSARDSSRFQSSQYHVGQGLLCPGHSMDPHSPRVEALVPKGLTFSVSDSQKNSMEHSQNPPHASIVNDPDDGKVLVSSRKIPFSTNLALYIVVRQQHQYAYASPSTVRNMILIACFSVEGGLIVLTQILSNFIVHRIVRLNRATNNDEHKPSRNWCYSLFSPSHDNVVSITSRKSDFFAPSKVPLRDHWPDEIDDITGRFNQLSENLSKEYAILNSRVMARRSEIEAAHEAANKASNAKTQFLARITHELRTPLNGIMATASITLEEKNFTLIHQNLRTITRCGELLLRLLMDLLYFTEERNENTFDKHDFTVSEISSQLSAIFSEQSLAKNAKLLVEIEPSTKSYILHGDANRILQIIFNIVSNGLKYTPQEGTLICHMSLMSKDNRSGLFRLEVEDEGPGIPHDLRSKIFEEFVRGGNFIQDERQGMGLGLYISRQLAESMGGSIELESEVGKGSKFSLVIPLQVSTTLTMDGASKDSNHTSESSVKSAERPRETNEAGTCPETYPQRSEKRLSSLRALLVDDNKVNLMVLQRMLKLEGITDVVLAYDGYEAIKKVQNAFNEGKSFDIIFMDIQMPKMDGRQTTLHLRNEENVTVPIIAVSAYASEENAERCISMGMNMFLSKPVRRPGIHKILTDLRLMKSE